MNALGLLTKQEAKDLRDLQTNPNTAKVFDIAEIIKGIQYYATEIELNMVVHDDVVSYFKNTMSYTVTEIKTGQPPGFTKLIKISWAI